VAASRARSEASSLMAAAAAAHRALICNSNIKNKCTAEAADFFVRLLSVYPAAAGLFLAALGNRID